MRKIHVKIEENNKFLIEIQKHTFFITFDKLDDLGLSKNLLIKLKDSIKKALEQNIDEFTLKY